MNQLAELENRAPAAPLPRAAVIYSLQGQNLTRDTESLTEKYFCSLGKE